MPSVRRIAPLDSLEFGFRAAYSQTVDAIIDATGCAVTDAGVLQFYNDLDELLGEIDLSPFFKLKNEVDPVNGGLPVDYPSATEEDEGFVKLATVEDALSGVDERKAITPAVLAYLLDYLQLQKTILQLTNAASAADRSEVFKKLLGTNPITLIGSENGASNLFIKRFDKDFSGISVINPDNTSAGAFGLSGGEIEEFLVQVANKNLLQVGAIATRIFSTYLFGTETQATFQTIDAVTPRAVTDYTRPTFWEPTPNGTRALKEGTLNGLGLSISPYLNGPAVAALVGPYINNTPVPGDLRYPEGVVLCFQEDDELPAYSSQIITVSSPTVGSVFTVNHTLGRADLWASAKSLNTATVQVENSNQVSVYIDTAVNEFTFKLEPKNAIS